MWGGGRGCGWRWIGLWLMLGRWGSWRMRFVAYVGKGGAVD